MSLTTEVEKSLESEIEQEEKQREIIFADNDDDRVSQNQAVIETKNTIYLEGRNRKLHNENFTHILTHDDESNAGEDTTSGSNKEQKNITLNAQFSSFLELRAALEKYQKEKHIQLIVKDSKLLTSDSMRKILPKVYHLVNQSLMYHSLTYCCKCHGELKQKPGSRLKNVGANRLNCPMYIRFKLSLDLQQLILFDMMEDHNHPTDRHMFSQSPRQQPYRLSRIHRGESDPMKMKVNKIQATPHHIPKMKRKNTSTTTIVTTDDTTDEPNSKTHKVGEDMGHSKHCAQSKQKCDKCNSDDSNSSPAQDYAANVNKNYDQGNGDSDCEDVLYNDNEDSPLDPESSCSDSDEEEIRRHLKMLPLPIRLIGSAVQCSPELLSLTKEVIQTQKESLLLKKRVLLLQTRKLELENTKLALEVRNLERSPMPESDQQTTFYVQS